MTQPSHLVPLAVALLLSVAAIDHSLAQDSAERIDKSCDRIRCYQPGSFPVTLNDGSEATFELKVAVPIVKGDVVSMLPGTTVFVSGSVVEGKLVNLRVVEKPTELKDVLQIRMWQEPGMADTFLVVTNYFHDVVKYRAAMLFPQADEFHSTSSCAVLGDGRVGYEHWPHAIFQLVLADFVFRSADIEELRCE